MSGGHFSYQEFHINDIAEKLEETINLSKQNRLLKSNGATEEGDAYNLIHQKVSPEAFKNKDWHSINYQESEFQIQQLIKNKQLVLYRECKILDLDVEKEYEKFANHLTKVYSIVRAIDYHMSGDSSEEEALKLIKELKL